MYSFPLGESERIIKKGHASLHLEDSAYTGAFYLTDERLVFVGYVVNITMKYMEDVPLSSVREIRKGKTFHIIPNVMFIDTYGGRSVKVIVDPGERNAWVAAIDDQLAKKA